jgi:hypothetical protein
MKVVTNNDEYKKSIAPYLCFLFMIMILFIQCTPRYAYKCNFSLSQPVISNNLSYSDSLIDIIFTINTDRAEIGFVLNNKSDKTIKLNWDDFSYVSIDNNANRVMHTGVRYIERDKSQAPTTIPSGTKLVDGLTPVECIYYSAGWQTTSLFANYKKNELENKDISIYMPMLLGDQLKEYTFRFHINKIEEIDLDTETGNPSGCLTPGR